MHDRANLDGKVALITGAAQGIGRAIAYGMAERGASVVITDVQEQRGRAVESEIRRKGMDAHFIKCDLTDEGQIKMLVDFCVDRGNRLDIVVNNARPRLICGEIAETMPEWDLAMSVMLKAPMLILTHALEHLVASKGVIINMSSTNAFSVSHQPASYHVAKAGLVQMTRYLAYHLGSTGIRVNVVSPGLVDADDRVPLTSDPVNNRVTKMTVPLRRATSPKEIARVVAFLCSEQANYITGQVLTLDGGLSLGDHFHVAREAYRASLKRPQQRRKSPESRTAL